MVQRLYLNYENLMTAWSIIKMTRKGDIHTLDDIVPHDTIVESYFDAAHDQHYCRGCIYHVTSCFSSRLQPVTSGFGFIREFRSLMICNSYRSS